MTRAARDCKRCGPSFTPTRLINNFCPECRQINQACLPAVYRWIAPDGRSYVGSTVHVSIRADHGIARTNKRLDEALKEYPFETWTYEVLERLNPTCSESELREAEQRHINRLRSWMPEHGFNPGYAAAELACSEHRAQYSADIKRAAAESAERWRAASERYWSEREANEDREVAPAAEPRA